MKTLKTVAVIATLFISNLLSAQWAINGNVVSTGDYFGTNNAEPLLFRTDGILRMTLSDEGNLGLNAHRLLVIISE